MNKDSWVGDFLNTFELEILNPLGNDTPEGMFFSLKSHLPVLIYTYSLSQLVA